MAATLSWDQETYMPCQAVTYRAQQLSWLSGKIHTLKTSEQFQKTLEAAENNHLNDLEAANIREIRHSFDRSRKLPQELVEQSSTASSLAKAAWAEARQTADFSKFAPHLETLLDIARQKADLWGYPNEPYDALLEGYERAAKTCDVAQLFDSISDELAETAQTAVDRSASTPENTLQGHYPIAKQQQLNQEIAEDLGFDFSSGRIDTTTHPFCTGIGPNDVRLTTRYQEDNFTSSLFGVLHEAGHGLYEQGLTKEHYGLPTGTTISLGIHESQSRLWENHIGRSRPFWTKWLPRAQEIFPNLANIELNTFLSAVNRAEKSYIRVEADEATYDLHILLRFELERAMLNREINVKDIPEAWNQGFKKLFNMTPPDDAQGCLQDIHWSMGGIGYFATYTLGNFNAAQLYHKAMQNDEIAKACDSGNYRPILEWMRQKIHNKGSTLLPQDLMQSATGETTNPRYHLDHLKQRFL